MEEEEESGRSSPVLQPDRGASGQFDVSLPARHLYLGELEEEGQIPMEDEETTPTLPLLCLPDRVLFPGETLPMHVQNPHTMLMLRDVATRHRPVAIVTDLRSSSQLREMVRPTKEELSKVGTTAEVVGMRLEGEDYTQWSPFLTVKLFGRQRFRLMEIFRRVNGQMEGRVVILPEMRLSPPPLALSPCPPCLHSGALVSRLVARAGSTSPFTLQQNSRHSQVLKRSHVSGSLCQVPAWVFSLHDKDYLRQEIAREEMMRVGRPEETSLDQLPEDTISLSYWLSRRLPISDQEKLSLLSIHCPTLRLIQALHILQVPPFLLSPSSPPSSLPPSSSSVFFLASLPTCPHGLSSVIYIRLFSFHYLGVC
jgi:ATP-dependent Lon protease